MDIEAIRSDFPFFADASAPIYLDNAATTQKPRQVIERLVRFYTSENANIHRGGYALAEKTTRLYEQARATIGAYTDAAHVAFTQNATDSLNLAIRMVAAERFARGKNAVTTAVEHHSAFLPLQQACLQKETELRILPLTQDGAPNLSALDVMLDENTACAVLTLGANSTGWMLPWRKVLPQCRERNIPVILDATQYIAHERLSVKALGCDFLCFSGHKIYGPMGIGVLCMNDDWAQNGVGRLGGGMVQTADAFGFSRIDGVRGWEAGTPPIAQALGLEAAVQYVRELGYEQVYSHEKALLKQLKSGLSAIAGIRIIGDAGAETLPVVAFTSDVLHAADLSKMLDARGFALRSGRHCAHLYHERMGVSATVRASIGLYNTQAEIDALLETVEDMQQKWRRYTP